MLLRLFAEQVIYVKKVICLLAEVREAEELSQGRNSGRQKFDPSIREKLQSTSEGKEMSSHRETLKNLLVCWQDGLAATEMPFKNSGSRSNMLFSCNSRFCVPSLAFFL